MYKLTPLDIPINVNIQVHSLFRAIVQHDSPTIILHVENVSGSAYLRSADTSRSRHTLLHTSAYDVVSCVWSPEITDGW